MTDLDFNSLIKGYMDNSLNEAEKELFFQEVIQPHNSERFREVAASLLEDGAAHAEFDPSLLPVLKQVLQSDRSNTTKVRTLRYRSIAAAAAVLICLAGSYYYFTKRPDMSPLVKEIVIKDRQPGRQGAVLTLEDGQEVQLDTVRNPHIALLSGQEAALQEGVLRYDRNPAHSGASGYNKLSTPRGRQFRVNLPDGTGVWLNASTSLRYPIAFADHERVVEITGEAYFEVVADARKPFRVKLPDGTMVQVLGTSFNVQAYVDEPVHRTTLLSGGIAVSSGLQQYYLKPGQEAILQAGELQKVTVADTGKAVAWRNGEFHFEGQDLKIIMRELSRWYDVNVRYEGTVRNTRFVGGMNRQVNLSSVLAFLRKSGIELRLEDGGATIVIM